MKNAFLTAIMLIFVVSASISADRIVMNNGDALTGTITETDSGAVVIKTELAGTVKIPLTNVKTMSTEKPLELHLKDGSVVNQPLQSADAGTVKVDGKSDAVELADVVKINPEKPRWKGDFAAGVTYTSGNTKNESYAFSGNLSKRTEKDRTTFAGDAAKKKEGSDKTVTEDWWRVGGKYDYFLSKKCYVYGQGRYEVDEIADLDQRIIAGGGTGYQWIETDLTGFSTEVGASWIDEEYADNTSDDKISAQAGYRLNHQFNETFSFINNFNYFPSVEKVSDYYLTTTGELRAKINSHLFTNFKVLFDYDATPAAGKGSSDMKYIFGAGVTF
jgi:putative salt-induced outer membrane protein YdiY